MLHLRQVYPATHVTRLHQSAHYSRDTLPSVSALSLVNALVNQGISHRISQPHASLFQTLTLRDSQIPCSDSGISVQQHVTVLHRVTVHPCCDSVISVLQYVTVLHRVTVHPCSTPAWLPGLQP